MTGQSDGGSWTSDRERQAAALVALVAVVGLVLGAFVLPVRWIVLAALLAGLVLSFRLRFLAWPVAAMLPAALNLAWGTLPQPTAEPGDIHWCADLLSPLALWRAGEAVGVFVLVGLLLMRLHVRAAEIGLVRPSARLLAVSLGAAAIVTIASVALGTTVAAPFFGTVELKFDDVGAIIPALTLAIANGAMEEVCYRGAMLHWLSPSLGVRGALLAQAVCFGAAHIGPDSIGSPLPVLLVVGAGGLVAGLIVRRTGSLTFPIAVHVALDIPLYYVAACRLQ